MDRRRRALIAALAAATVAPARADSRIVLKRIPSSGEELPAIGIGTWQTFDVRGDPAALSPLREVLEAFAEAGGRVVDSSPMYGAAESVVGELTAGPGLRDRLFMATKVWTHGREQGIRQMEESFRRMRVERMDLMQVHNLADVETHTRTLKVAVIANRPFQEGALFSHVKGKPLPAWAAELDIRSWAQYFLKWIVSHPALTCAIPATARAEHIRDNVAAGFGALPDPGMRKKMVEYFDSV